MRSTKYFTEKNIQESKRGQRSECLSLQQQEEATMPYTIYQMKLLCFSKSIRADILLYFA